MASLTSTPISIPALQPVAVLPQRGFFVDGSLLSVDAVIEEQHQDRAQITDHPVEQGSTISDNVVDLPNEVIVTYGWAPSSPLNTSASPTFLRGLYDFYVALKQSKTPFTIYTGKRTYKNMLIETISLTTDVKTENNLILRMLCREVIIVLTTTVTVPVDQSRVAAPQQSLGTTKRGVQGIVDSILTPSQKQSILNFFSGPLLLSGNKQ